MNIFKNDSEFLIDINKIKRWNNSDKPCLPIHRLLHLKVDSDYSHNLLLLQSAMIPTPFPKLVIIGSFSQKRIRWKTYN